MKALNTTVLGLFFGAIIAWFVSSHWYQPQYPVVSFANAVSRAAPAVVNIYTTKLINNSQQQSDKNDDFFSSQQKQRFQQKRELSLGSGVIISHQGFIVTNYHVISNAEEILVLLYDGREALAHIVGVDRDTDLAILKIDLASLIAIRFAKNENLRVGDPALAIGNPFGFGQSVTAGIVSATGRYGLNLNTYENYIQTDAAINVGNSGGALINYKGELIGINSAIYSQTGSSQGIGLAIPIDIVSKVAHDIIVYGHVIRGWLGLEVTQLNARIATQLGIHKAQGVIITNTYRNGPAQLAGLLPGDVIIRINNTRIDNGQEGLLEVANLDPGQSILVEVVRNNHSLIIPVIVGIRPNSP